MSTATAISSNEVYQFQEMSEGAAAAATAATADKPSSPTLRAFATIPRPTFSSEEYLQYEKRKRQKLKIVELIERFYHQIRYGCTASICTTSTCRAHRSQKKTGVPYRVPTPVTARAIAAYLAALDDPLSCLCSNTPAPKSNPFDLAFPTSRCLYFLLETEGEGFSFDSATIKNPTNDLSGTAEWYAKAEFEEWMHNQALSNTPIDLERRIPYRPDQNLDTKSFAQRLFTSFTWKWLPLSEDDRNPLCKMPRPEHQASGADPSYSPLKAIFHELENVSELTKTESLLMGGEVNFPLFKMAYHDRDFLNASTHTNRLWWTPKEERAPGQSVDIAKLSETLGNPSKLMLCGLNPFPIPRSDALASRGPFESDSVNLGLQFFQSRLSQPHAILYLEFAMLETDGEVDPHFHLEWLASSVKSTTFNPNIKQNIPSAIAAHIVAVAIAALSATVFSQTRPTMPPTWDLFQMFRRQGHVMFDSYDRPKHWTPDKRELLDDWSLAYEEPVAQYLMTLILRSFASWSYASTQISDKDHGDTEFGPAIKELKSDFKHRLLVFLSGSQSFKELTNLLTLGLLEWVRTIFLRNWNGQNLFQWNTDVGASIDFMRWMYSHRDELNIPSRHFAIHSLLERMDYVEACEEWMESKTAVSTGRLLDFPWLFVNHAKVTIFRSINFCRMFTAYGTSYTTSNLVGRMSSHIKPAARQVLDKLSTSMATFLVLDIRRDNILRDSFNQLWRRQKRELFRPLKVRMGMDEGEEGVDMGGVQQEFFRLAIADALSPDNGLFTVDERTRMTWFQPMSAAPLYQFTLIGMLFGLAVYNGITLAITFPLAFYRKLLLIRNIHLQDIEDGWPELHTGLNSLLTWSEGQVEEVFLRTYTFSFESLGVVHDVDMKQISREEEWPVEHQKDTSPSPGPSDTSKPSKFSNIRQDFTEPDMVTNKNREEYVNDYIFWLTDKSIAPQFQAFAAGFYLPLQKKALGIFTPSELQLLLEGQQTIDIEGLKKTTRYEDGFGPRHARIQEFWQIVQDFSPDQHKNLLEFVTASPRVPVRGMEEVTFIIQRNGVGDERLPSSMTCFGRLLLPEYSSKEIMAEKLRIAIENSTGFGTQ